MVFSANTKAPCGKTKKIAFRNIYMSELYQLSFPAKTHACVTVYQEITENIFDPSYFIAHLTHEQNSFSLVKNYPESFTPLIRKKSSSVHNLDNILL